jgi:hypothetical protein
MSTTCHSSCDGIVPEFSAHLQDCFLVSALYGMPAEVQPSEASGSGDAISETIAPALEEEYQPTEAEMDAIIADALECPCVADLKEGPCGQPFVQAFVCFHKSKSTPKGNDCYERNVAFVDCLKQHPAAADALADGNTFQKLSDAESKLKSDLTST